MATEGMNSERLVLVTVYGAGRLLRYQEDVDALAAKMGAKVIGVYPNRIEAEEALKRLQDLPPDLSQ